MKLWLVSVCTCLLCLSLPVVLGLTCFTCSTTISWDGCATSSQTCPPASERCGKVYTKVGEVETFARKCLLKDKCVTEANTTCKATFGTMECEVHCCDSDDCNAGSTFRISGILLLGCALASLMILVNHDIDVIRSFGMTA